MSGALAIARAHLARLELLAMPSWHVEGRVLTAVVFDAGFLARTPQLEVDDFADLRNQAVFTAVRTLEASGRRTDCIAIDEHMLAMDRRLGRNLAEHAGIFYLGLLLCDHPRYADVFVVDGLAEFVFDADVRELRILADARRDA